MTRTWREHPKEEWVELSGTEQNALLFAQIERCHPDALFVDRGGMLVERKGDEVQKVAKQRLDTLAADSLKLRGQKGALGPVSERHLAQAIASASDSTNRLRELRGVAGGPYFWGDSLDLVGTSGYHRASQLWLPESKVPVEARCLCEGDCGRAICASIEARIFSSRFADDASRLHVGMAALAPFLLPAVAALGPAFLMTASASGAGKTFLVEVICALRNRRLQTIAPAKGSNNNEINWKLVTAIEAGGHIVIDNLERGTVFENAEIAALLTASGSMQLRTTKSAPVEVDFRGRMLFLTGIDIELQYELARRTLVVRLMPLPSGALETNPVQWINQNRQQVQANLIRGIRAWIEADTPPPPSPHPSFARWSSIVAGAACFIWPELSSAWRPARTEVPATEQDFAILLEVWPRTADGGHKSLRAKDVRELAREHRLFALLRQWCASKGPSTRKIGDYLTKRADFETGKGRDNSKIHRPRGVPGV